MFFVQNPFHALGRARKIDGSDALVRVLRALFGGVEIGLFGNVLLAVLFRDKFARPLLGLRGNADGVGTDIRDEGDVALLFGVDALVQVLGDEHDVRRGHAEFVGRVLLQRGRGKGRGSVRSGDRLFDVLHDVRVLRQFRAHALVFLRGGGKVLFAVLFAEKRLERGVLLGFVLQFGVDVPVLFGDEGADLALPVHDEAQGDRLHAARRKTRTDALAQKRRELVAHQSVQHAARLLGVDEVIVDLAGVLQCPCDRRGRNFVEFDAVFALFEL